MWRIVGFLICLMLPGIAAAQTFDAINKLKVIPQPGGDFEVIEARGEGARGMWCAAADFAMARNPANGQRLYVKKPRGPSVSVAGRKGVTFTVDAARLGVSPTQALSVSVRSAGQGLPLHHAFQFCRDYQIELNDILLRRGG